MWLVTSARHHRVPATMKHDPSDSALWVNDSSVAAGSIATGPGIRLSAWLTGREERWPRAP
jgi:hypothetical protein